MMFYTQIHTGKENKTYKDYRNDRLLQYFSKKEFKKQYGEDGRDEYEFLGCIYPGKKEWNRDIHNGSGSYAVHGCENKHGRHVGYIMADLEGSEGYLEVRMRWIPVILMILLAVILISGILWGLSALVDDGDYGGVIYTDSPLTEEQKKEAGRQIEFPGFSDMILEANSPGVVLGNPKTNHVTFEYILLDKKSGGELFRTEKMAPGSGLSLDFRNLLGQGNHNVKILVNTYSMENGSPRNNMEFNIEVTVKE